MFMGPCVVNHYQCLSNKIRLYTVYCISVNFSTCFGWYPHLSSGAHITVITASGTGYTVTATVRDRTIADGSSYGGWSYRPKHVEEFTEIQGYYKRNRHFQCCNLYGIILKRLSDVKGADVVLTSRKNDWKKNFIFPLRYYANLRPQR